MPVTHWLAPDAAADISAEANRPDRARCVAICVTSALARRLHGALPVTVDDTIPEQPGYELIREAP